jgi:hypothetical protein
MDVLDAISYMLLFLAAGPFLDKLFLAPKSKQERPSRA